MIQPLQYLEGLTSLGVDFFTGVPDSLLKDFCSCLLDHTTKSSHWITANEGAAVSLAMGYHLATGKTPLVYMQNSGLGNTVNPLLSLASPEVYAVPLLLMIGWRGEPDTEDEPQHVHQGRVMNGLLTSIEVPFIELSDNFDVAISQTKDALRKCNEEHRAVALVVRKGLFGEREVSGSASKLQITREQAIFCALQSIKNDAAIIATTGMASRELFEIRSSQKLGHHRDFLTVGGMGHASQIALGIAVSQPQRKVFCFDGDGAALMHMGSMAINGQSQCENFVHLLFNNGVHGSVGGQPTVGFQIEFSQIAKACGYAQAEVVDDEIQLSAALDRINDSTGPLLLKSEHVQKIVLISVVQQLALTRTN